MEPNFNQVERVNKGQLVPCVCQYPGGGMWTLPYSIVVILSFYIKTSSYVAEDDRKTALAMPRPNNQHIEIHIHVF